MKTRTNENSDALVNSAVWVANRMLLTTAIVAGVIFAGACPSWVGPIAIMLATPTLYLTWFAK